MLRLRHANLQALARLLAEALRPVVREEVRGAVAPLLDARRRASLMTLDEVAAALRCSRKSVARRIARGQLGAVKEGGRTLVHPDALDAYLRANAGTGG